MKYSSYIRDMREYRWFGKKIKKDFKKNNGYLSKCVFFKITVIIEVDLKYLLI